MSSPIFSQVKAAYAATSIFNLSFENKLTTNWFRITPILCKEVLPGDTWRVSSEILVRLAPMFAPLMHQIKVYTHFFFVPYRLLWDEWESFITQSEQGHLSSGVPTELPTVTVPFSVTEAAGGPLWASFGSGSLSDYLGLNFNAAGLNFDVDQEVDPCTFQYLPFLAYSKIYNDFYRDENLEDDDFVPAISGNFTYGTSDLDVERCFSWRYRYWKKDYFTSALPWTQKGSDVTLPLGGTAPVTGTVDFSVGGLSIPSNQVRSFEYYDGSDSGTSTDVLFQNGNLLGESAPGTRTRIYGNIPKSVTGYQNISQKLLGVTADLSQATPTTINELRRAIALQRWEEINARGGTRYVEQLAAHFGVRPRDSRLQRAEYLGGGVSDVVISEVLQTSASEKTDSNGNTTVSPQGNMAGHGISASYNHAFKRYFDEHGVVIGLLTIVPKANYFQGAQRMYLKRSVYDFGWPSLAHLGEQPIYTSELFNEGIERDVEADEVVFGYTPRYAEYKFSNDEIHGDFRTSLSNWHAGRLFASTPALNYQFANGENFAPDVFAVNDGEDPFWIQLYNDCKVTRKLPKFGTPSL